MESVLRDPQYRKTGQLRQAGRMNKAPTARITAIKRRMDTPNHRIRDIGADIAENGSSTWKKQMFVRK